MSSAASHSSIGALSQATIAGRRDLRVVLSAQLLRTAFRLGFSGSTAILVGQLVMQQPVAPWHVAMPAVFLVLASALGFAADRLQASAEARVADQVRTAAAARLSIMSVRRIHDIPVGQFITGIQRHPESIAALVIGHKAATTMMAIGPLMAAAALFAVSWQAALLVLCLTPVMIVFFALVGDAIRRRADAQKRAFGKLAGQFADRIRSLPTILANHALPQEEHKLSRRLSAYAENSMGVLRIAFVNAAIIDFFASLSIAMLAVFLGLGHLKLAMIPGFSDLELWQSLFILMIAPDYFAPYRRFSEQYHAKAEGMAAAVALDGLLGRAEPSEPALPRIQIDIPSSGLIAIVGPSGSGKSTQLRRIAGIEPGHREFADAVAGREISWISTDAHISAGTLGEIIASSSSPCQTRLKWAAGMVGLLDDTLLPGGLDAAIARGGGNLSGGQRLRISIARALLGQGVVLADEPTAKLDPANAARIRRALSRMSRRRLVIVATHDAKLACLADRTVDLGGGDPLGAAA